MGKKACIISKIYEHALVIREPLDNLARELKLLVPSILSNTDISFEDHILIVYLENFLLLTPSLCICFMATAISKRGRNTIALLLKQIVV